MRALSTPLLAALAAAAVSPAFAAPAHKPAAAAAAPTGAASDVRCLLSMTVLSQDKQRQQAAQVGVYYFAGRLSARGAGFDLVSAAKAEAPRLGPADFQAELKRCGTMIEASSRAVQAALVALRGPGPVAPQAAPATAPPPAAPK